MASAKESADDYIGLVAIVGPRWRVIDSMEPYPYRQWILQYNGSVKQSNRWTAQPPFGSFCQTKKVLIRCIKEKVSDVDPDGMKKIEELPDQIRGIQ